MRSVTKITKAAKITKSPGDPHDRTARRTFTIRREPVGSLYRELIRTAIEEASRAFLVTRDSVPLNSAVQGALRQLSDHEIDCRTVSKWPGTTLLSDASATLREYRCSEQLGDLLTALANGLYDWVDPKLPEDLGFLRSDGSTWLGSIAHERDAFLEVDDEEMQRLLDEHPQFRRFLNSAPDRS